MRRSSTNCSDLASSPTPRIRPVKPHSIGRCAAATRRRSRRCEGRVPSDTDAIKEVSVEKSIALLQASGSQFSRTRDARRVITSTCRRWHSVPPGTHGIAWTRPPGAGNPTLRSQCWTESAKKRCRIATGFRMFPSASVTRCWSLSAIRHAADEVTDAMARVIAAWQSDDGAFHPLPALRPPIEAGTVDGNRVESARAATVRRKPG